MNLKEFTKDIVALNREHGFTDEQILGKDWLAGFAHNVSTDLKGKYPIKTVIEAVIKEVRGLN